MDVVAPFEERERSPRFATVRVGRLGGAAEPVERAADLACADQVAAARAWIRLAGSRPGSTPAA